MERFGQARPRECLARGQVHCGKGQRSCRKLNMENFRASDGWLAGFKSRHGIKLLRESGSADLEGSKQPVQWLAN